MRDDRGEVGITHFVQRVAVRQAVRLHFDVVVTMKDLGSSGRAEPGLALPFSGLFS